MDDKSPSLFSKVFSFLDQREMIRLAEYSDTLAAQNTLQSAIGVAEVLPFTGADVSFLRAMRIDPWR